MLLNTSIVICVAELVCSQIYPNLFLCQVIEHPTTISLAVILTLPYFRRIKNSLYTMCTHIHHKYACGHEDVEISKCAGSRQSCKGIVTKNIEHPGSCDKCDTENIGPIDMSTFHMPQVTPHSLLYSQFAGQDAITPLKESMTQYRPRFCDKKSHSEPTTRDKIHDSVLLYVFSFLTLILPLNLTTTPSTYLSFASVTLLPFIF